MKNKFLKKICGMMAGIVLMSVAMPLKAEAATVDEICELIDGVVAYKTEEEKCGSGEKWAEQLTETAGTGSEWYFISLIQNRSATETITFAKRLKDYTLNNNIPGATARQRIALAMIACGAGEDSFVKETINDSMGKMGIMSWIFGLHLVNNGAIATDVETDSLIREILSERKEDGGWAIMGEASDTDVTAMALQALAPYREEKEVQEAIDSALVILSEKQTENGDFTGFGQPNPESTAQVIIGLTALDIDPLEDERFIKNGNTAFQGLLRYRCSNGAWAHIYGGKENDSATCQALMALVALKRYYQGEGSFYQFDETGSFENENDIIEEGNKKEQNCEREEEKDNKDQETLPLNIDPVGIWTEPREINKKTSGINVKLFIYAGLILSGLILSLVLLLKGRKNKKNFIFIAAVCVILGLIVHFTEFSSKSDYYVKSQIQKENAIGSVTMTIRCDTLIGKADPEQIPKDGEIMPVTSYEIEEGDTVYDILIEAVKEYGIQAENRGSSSNAHGMIYIAGINYLYEQQFGELSGWIYHVNGVAPSCGCGDYILKDGDVIEWHYTCDLGRDL
ncbi:MAG: DUF4430 domain-containing protein [Lachnospiraceae bacterium]|nr:DUF4430 domain-containing protein [Lachnospiraceae bacterium]